jgi:hypothetical protein
MITREALRILHAKLHFVGAVNRQYDNRFAQSGAKIGTTLDIRVPPKYTTRSGATISSYQNSTERKIALPVTTQKGVDMNFSSVELTMQIDDFAKRFLEPAMAQLASTIEADALSMYKSVPSYSGRADETLASTATTNAYNKFQNGGRYMTELLAPVDNNRVALLNPQSRVDFSDAVKGLFQASQNIEEQYREGMMGRTGGFDVFESTLIPAHTPGSYTTGGQSNGATQGNNGANNVFVSTSDIILSGMGAAATLKAGDVITFAGCYEVHPETKVAYGYLKRFVVNADFTADGAGAGTVTVSPAVIYGGAFQNVSASVANASAVVKLTGVTASTAYGQNLMFHRDAFVFATADLEDVSQYGAWGAREVYDGISMRIARQYDIANDLVPTRIDVLYGYVAVYPELANRLVHQIA